MRHGRKINHLSRTSEHRKAMLSNMASSLIRHKRINTTLAKAKALRKFVEPILTKSKTDSTHSRRMVFSYLKDKEAVIELFRDVAPKIATRNGGYTRILKTGNRLGDNAEMCFIELVDYNENMLGGTAAKKAAKPTRRRGGKKTAAKGSETEVAEATDVTEGTEATEAPAKKAPAKKAAAKKEGAPAAAKKTAAKKTGKTKNDKE
jgi:large subunit ribosomal protein L17